ncbi:MAG: RloB family protein [Bacteroidales bacterium]|nr:RloB domain-containing protein [Lentimicrobiaceae bacterium]MDD5695098.1 RloB family protein [Bacteroidales bacterium]
MSRKRLASKGKRINPHYWVFCEGKTEEAYISFLRSKYRLPIEIVTKIAGNKINEVFIRNYKQGKPTHEKDKDFLMFDADVPEIFEKLISVKSVILIASNPSIELWFLLHYKNITTCTTTIGCMRELSNRNRNQYQKGVIDKPLENKLNEKCAEACKRSIKMK